MELSHVKSVIDIRCKDATTVNTLDILQKVVQLLMNHFAPNVVETTALMAAQDMIESV